MTFHVYPKKGDKISLDCADWKQTGDWFVFIGSDKSVYFYAKNIAAIIPVRKIEDAEVDTVPFIIQLKRHTKGIEVHAHHFETEPTLSFKIELTGVPHVFSDIKGLYVEPSEVVAVGPPSLLVADRSQKPPGSDA